MQQTTIHFMKKATAQAISGGTTQTSKMPCKSYSLPTLACKTGYKMAQIEGSICSHCYANKGFYKMYENNILPVQMARLDSLGDPLWVSSLVALIGADKYFRWHDSGDLQGVQHLRSIAEVCEATPATLHWLPTREYSMIKEYIQAYGPLPVNLTVRLSAMYPDKPVVVPASLQGVQGVTVSNVHTHGAQAMGTACIAPTQGGQCGDCRKCWTPETISYGLH